MSDDCKDISNHVPVIHLLYSEWKKYSGVCYCNNEATIIDSTKICVKHVNYLLFEFLVFNKYHYQIFNCVIKFLEFYKGHMLNCEKDYSIKFVGLYKNHNLICNHSIKDCLIKYLESNGNFKCDHDLSKNIRQYCSIKFTCWVVGK